MYTCYIPDNLQDASKSGDEVIIDHAQHVVAHRDVEYPEDSEQEVLHQSQKVVDLAGVWRIHQRINPQLHYTWLYCNGH